MPLKGASTVDGRQPLSLKESEKALIKEITARLLADNPAEAEIVEERFECLESFGRTIALFPLIRETQTLLGSARDDKLFIQSLVGLAPSSRLLHIPARIQAVRSFLVTKFHAFSLLSKLAAGNPEFSVRVQSAVFSVLFTIMAEDVYFSCIGEPRFPRDMKPNLADELVSLWDSGSELAMVKHFPALEALWIARNDAPPSFGTLDGTSEIFRISIDLGNDWHDFLIHRLADEETKWALDEFLFGLSYEELISVRSRLRRFGINAVDFNEIHAYLGSRPAYLMVKNADPRMLYDFYIDRKEASLLRKRLGAPGPYKTLEEIYLEYRLYL
ncbi:MAG: hypothetical protein LBI67_04545 [Treponema sp.]|jgi:hypothetical protein|nr:hypothetical protein [Treponema sp.]